MHPPRGGEIAAVRMLAVPRGRNKRGRTGPPGFLPDLLPPSDYEVCRGDEPAGERVVVRGTETHWSLPARR